MHLHTNQCVAIPSKHVAKTLRLAQQECTNVIKLRPGRKLCEETTVPTCRQYSFANVQLRFPPAIAVNYTEHVLTPPHQHHERSGTPEMHRSSNSHFPNQESFKRHNHITKLGVGCIRVTMPPEPYKNKNQQPSLKIQKI